MRRFWLFLALIGLAPVFAATTSEEQKVLHALNRLTWGPRAADVGAVSQTGLARWIDDQLHPETIAETPVLLEKLAAPHPSPEAIRAGADLVQARLLRAVYSNRQLEDVLTDFWYNHFNVYLNKGADRMLVTAYERDVIRPRVLGKFRDLLVETAQSPAMLFYLDNWRSSAESKEARGKRSGLNENYGRELMELHTLGVDGGYSQQDVTEVARCFTGWTIRDLRSDARFFFNARIHDRGEKHVLGVTIPAGGGMDDGLRVLKILSRHPSTARFISREMAVRFVSDDPPPALVEKMAKSFLTSDGDLRALMKTMFDAPEFWDPGTFRARLKSPLELVASALRATGAEIDYTFSLDATLTQMGEPLYRKVEPTGYPNRGVEWMNSASLLARMNFGLALAGNRLAGVTVPLTQAGAETWIGSPEFQRK